MSNLKKALERKLRFDSSKGPLSLEQFFTLKRVNAKDPKFCVEGIVRSLASELEKFQENESTIDFLSTSKRKSTEQVNLEIKFEIAKERYLELEKLENSALERQKKEKELAKIDSRLEELKDENFNKLSAEELLKRRAELEG